MIVYKTADGQIFRDEDDAVIHAKVLDYMRQGLEVLGQPYEYSEVEKIDA